MRRQILTLTRLSQIRSDLSQPELALKTGREALIMAESWLRASPGDPERLDVISQVLQANLLYKTKDVNEKLALFRRSEEIFAASKPGNEAVKYHRLRLHSINARNTWRSLIETGKLDEGHAMLRESCMLGEKALDDKVQNDLILYSLGGGYSDIADLESASGRTDDAETAFRRSNALFQIRFEQQPKVLSVLLDYCTSCEQLEIFFQRRGSIADLNKASQFSQNVVNLLNEALKKNTWRM
jgi:hypothetical protein